MRVWQLAVVFLITSVAKAETNLDREFQKCQQSADINELSRSADNADPAEMEQLVAEATKLVQKTCKGASDAITALEARVQQLNNAVLRADQDFSTPAEKADQLSRAELSKLYDELSQFRAIPNVPSDENNQLFNRLETLYTQSSERIADSDRNWDVYFKPAPESSIETIKTLSKDRDLPAQAKSALEAYLNRIPPYLLGNGPAPREKIEFLKVQSLLVKREIGLKRQDYSRPIRDSAYKSLDNELAPDAMAAKVEEIRSGLLKRFSYRNMTWAAAAKGSGACLLARDTITGQIGTLLAAIRLLPSPIQKLMSNRLENDLNIRRVFLTQSSCQSEPWDKNQKLSLQRWSRILSTICQRPPQDVQTSIDGLLTDIKAFSIVSSKPYNSDEENVVRLIGAELWSRGYYLATTCG